MTPPAEASAPEPANDEDVITAAEAILTVENAGLPLVVLYPDRRIAMANRAMRELLGYTSDELVGRSLSDLVVDGTDLGASWEQLLRQGSSAEHLLRFRHRSGATVITRAAAAVVFNGDGTPRLVIKRASAA
jgi:PAS domain S-box-containing protein